MAGSSLRDHLSTGELRAGLRGGEIAAQNPSVNWAELAFSVCRVKEIQYEELKCTLVVLTGESDIFEYTGVDLTLPGGGRRHFFGAIPERGDLCLVGWAARESSGTASTRTPIIIGWVPPAPWMGQEWLPFARFGPGEGLDTPRERSTATGLAERVRFKLRHAGPGDILASSSGGSDLVLNEEVLLTNRRGAELRLRDADSAFVVRSVVEFHAQAGTRVYSGPVQREARLLPTTIFSDGVYWDAPIPQVDAESNPLPAELLGRNPYPVGFLTPGLIFARGTTGATQSEFEAEVGEPLSNRLDPFDFLQWGSFVDNQGFRINGRTTPEVVYGGKSLYRVGILPGGDLPVLGVANAFASANSDIEAPESLSEYRIEVTHSSRGLLPVTEQTDGFDAERLPTQSPTDGNPLGGSAAAPFVEFVLGSVVGNDPFSLQGRNLYGVPLRPVIFSDGGTVAPGLRTGVGARLRDHAATLLQVSPAFGPGPASFVCFTKDSRLKAYLAGGGTSAEIALRAGLRMDVGGGVGISSGGFSVESAPGPGNVGVSLVSAGGGVSIFGGGTIAGASAAADADPASSSGGSAPSVLIHGTGNVTVRSEGELVLNSPRMRLTNATQIDMRAQSSVSISSGQRASLSAQQLAISASGSMSVQVSGPADSNPSSGPSHSFQINATPATGNAGGTTDSYTMTYGDRVEEFSLQGSHTTTLTVGDFLYETLQGKWKAKAGTNELSIDSSSGHDMTLALGDSSTTVSSGSHSVSAQQNATLRAITGSVTVAGILGVKLVSPGAPDGGILCGNDLDPLTGLRYDALGLVPRLQTLSPT
mgnify:CR=1 FL=1